MRNIAVVQPLPSLVMKSGPGCLLLFSRYERIAFIGQTELSVAPMYTLTPCLNGPVLDCFRNSCNRPWFFLLSTAMSLSDKWQDGSYEPSVGIVNSPTLRKPKRARQHIAQSVVLL